MKKFLRLVASILCVAMMMQMIPEKIMTALAAEAGNDSASHISAALQDQTKTEEAKILGELPDKRDADVKQYRMSDGSYMAVEYPTPVHYKSGGQWADIDNTLIDSDTGSNTAEKKDSAVKDSILSGFVNQNNSLSVKFAKNSKSNHLVRLKTDDYQISWGIKGLDEKKETVVSLMSAAKSEDKTDGLSVAQISNKKFTDLKNISSGCTYADIFPGVDLIYVVASQNVKEYIVLKGSSSKASFTFGYKLDNLEMRKAKDGSIEVYDPAKPETAAYVLEAPYMYDNSADGCYSNQVTMELTGEKGSYEITVTADEEWLKDPKRVFPVTIDPAIVTETDRSTVDDTYGSKSYPNNNYEIIEMFRVGYSASSGLFRSVVKVNLPSSIPSTSRIINASLNLTPYVYDSRYVCCFEDNPQINLHKMTGSWAEDTFKWSTFWTTAPDNNDPAGYDPTVIDYQNINTNRVYSWDITKLANEWFQSPGTNKGVLLKYNNENQSTYNQIFFCSSNWVNATAYQKPYAVIYYRDTNGVEDYWTYHSVGAGSSSTAYVNDFSGNLSLIHGDLSETGSRMPVALFHTYNSANFLTETTSCIRSGVGWRMNINQKVDAAGLEGYSYVYTDADGTRHYFIASSNKDEDGLGLSISDSGGYCTITDKKSNQLVFYSPSNGTGVAGCLYQMKDSNQNTATLYYTGNLVSSIVDGAGRTIQIQHNASSQITKIIDPASRETVFHYDRPGFLTSIDYPDSTTTTFLYDNNSTYNNRLVAVQSSTGSVWFTYDSNGRVSTCTEKGTGDVLGRSLTITYPQTNTTVFTDNQNRSDTYHFDSVGRTTDVVDFLGRAQYFKYGATAADINKIKSASAMQKTIINMLGNSDLEGGSGWNVLQYSPGNLSFAGDSVTITGETRSNKVNCLKIISATTEQGRILGDMQGVTLSANTSYTLSADLKTTNITTTTEAAGGAALLVRYTDSSNNIQTIFGDKLTGTDDWNRRSMTFSVPAGATNVSCGISITGASGTMYADSMQLETGESANRYNLIDNQDMISYSGTVPNSFFTCNNNANDGIALNAGYGGGNAYRMRGESGGYKYISQSMTQYGNAGDIYVFGAWLKADSVITGFGDRLYNYQLQFIYDDNTTEYFNVPVNVATNQWQYVSGYAKASKPYHFVAIYFDYFNNQNNSYLSKVQLYKDNYGQSYDYDCSGNLNSTVDIANQTASFSNLNNNIAKTIDPSGSSYEYVYDSANRMKCAKSSNGIRYAFKYDNYGNPVSSEILNDSQSSAIVSGKTYILRAKHSNKTLHVYNSADANNTAIVQYFDNGSYDQRWKVVYVGGGYYKFVSAISPSGRVLDVYGAYNQNGTQLQLYQDNGGSNQLWRLVPNSDGSYRILSKLSSDARCIDVNMGSTDDLGQIVIHDTYGSANQSWYFEDVETTTITSSPQNGGVYCLSSALSAMKMDGWDYNDYAGAPIKQWYPTGDSNQRFKLSETGGGYYKLTPMHSTTGKVLSAQTDNSLKITNPVSAVTQSGGHIPEADTVFAGFDVKNITCNGFDFYTYDVSDSHGVNGLILAVYDSSGYGYCFGSTAVGNNSWMSHINTAYFPNPVGNFTVVLYTGNWELFYYGITVTTPSTSDPGSSSSALGISALQEFKFIDNGNGTCRMQCKYNGYVLNVPSNVYSGGADYSFSSYAGQSTQMYHLTPVSKTISSTATYSANGNYLASVTDSRAKTTGFSYDQQKGTLNSETDANDKTTSYTYYNNDLLHTVSKSVGGQTVSNHYDYTNNKLSSITHNGFSYGFGYDAYGNTQSVSVGGQTLISNTYAQSDGVLTRSDYGNGQYVTYGYDAGERLISKSFNGNERFRYSYDGQGNLYKSTDLLTGVSYQNSYDFANRITRVNGSNGHTIKLGYDSKNRVNTITNKVGADSNTIGYVYGNPETISSQKNGLVYGITVNGAQKLSYGFDSLARMVSRTISGANNYGTSYAYIPGSTATSTTTLLASITNGSNAAISYTYDNVGNIESISEGGTQKAKYYYDELSQLVREDNVWLNKTITYTYDAGGNLTVKNEYAYTTGTLGTVITSHPYTYDTAWKDKLASYEGNTITYDSIGNPTQYYNGYTFTWQNGRQLASVNNGTNTINYQYNDNGIRTKKSVVNGATTDYYLNGSNIVTEIRGSDRLDYYYDEQGNLFGFKVNNASEYYYIRNGQNDIIGILDSTGAQVVSYSYDTWGKPVSTTGTLASTIGALNPFRYRGYYYDESSGLYYLNSRYYDANTGRFINVDGLVSSGQGLSSNNMFSYCGNNPVMRFDPSGHSWDIISNLFNEIGNAMNNMAPAYAGCGGAALLDGPLPFGDAIGLIGAIGLTIGAIAIGGYNAAQSIPNEKENDNTKPKDLAPALPKAQKNQAIFTENPLDFQPNGLLMSPIYQGNNGRIIKWFIPGTKAAIFEWDEDLNFGSHYHTMLVGWDENHMGTHYLPGTPVPEPWNSIFFGG